MTERTFEAPGPGTWEQDSTHLPRPVTPYVSEVFPEAFVAGFKEGSARYGLLFSHLEPAVVNGFVYYRDEGVNPEDAEEVERRFAAARDALETKLWRQDLELWDRDLMPDSIRRNRELQAVDLPSLDTEELVGHLEAVRDNAKEMVYRHHKFSVPSIIPVGLYLAKAMEWTGMDAGPLLTPLQGSSPVSLGVQDELRALVSALSEAGLGPDDFSGLEAQDTLDLLEGRDDAVGDATRAFLDAVGLRLAGGFDIVDPCAVELPEMLVATIWAFDTGDGARADEVEAATARVRDAVSPEHRDQFDELLGEARLVNRLRDERGIYNDSWATGIARQAVLEAGRRLAATGRISDAECALYATHDELKAMLRSEAGPSQEELSERRDRHVGADLDAVPPFLGPEPTPPPHMDGLPPHVAQMMAAMGVAIVEVFGRGPKPQGQVVRGRPVSPGVYTGTARVVGTPAESDRLRKGDVLVTSSTSAAFNIVLPLLGAIVTDRGGQLSHAAIVAREYGIPAVVGTLKATSVIPDGARVKVDGTAGTVEIA